MKWNGIGHFLAMDGYGLYVWGSLAMVTACLAVEVLALRARRRAALAALAEEARP